MDVRCGAGVDVERHAEFLKRILYDFVVAVDDILGGHPFGLGLYGDGHTMLVAAPYHNHILAAQAQETGVDVGGNVNSGKVADMYRAVGIGQRRGHERALEFLLHI